MLQDLPLYPVLAASDIDRAKAWYREKLDLTPEIEEPMGSLWYKTGDNWFLLYPTPSAGTAQNTVAHWTVPDLASVMTGLRDRGVTFEDYDFGNGMATVDGVIEVAGRSAAWFRDSEGNIFELTN